ncbi:MAG TPA: aminoacetone oxidase family FAD-binding enzyme [Cyanobacteria bacterium UBA11371]|nr:aminoacetone oxidase family FAD-binding enzyme [Cyanobacteria bacterium UBA11371]HBE31633.1 aminoacetone oxidase family FAD-binding enzyme [Cyanobacteria bacterium UBA11368]
MQPLKIAVIGGGAAGFFGAIRAALANPDAIVTLLEAGRQPLTKVRISGGGRCNVTHACFDPALLVQYYPRGGKALLGPFNRFQSRDTVAWFESRGVKLKTESDGRMFPITDNSETIVECLYETAKELGVKIRIGSPVVGVKVQEQLPITRRFEIELKAGGSLQSDRILLATGSNPTGYQIAQSLGHHIEPPVPSLFTFNIKDKRLEDLAGVSVDSARLRLLVAGKTALEQTGALLVTHWGLSGPAVLKLSAWGARLLHECNYQTTLVINWLPQYNRENLHQQLLAVRSQLARRQIAANCPVMIPRRLWQQLVSYVGIDPEQKWAELSNKVLNQLIQELCEGKYQIQGKGVFKEEFVTCGGVSLKQVNFKTMESRIVPGLFFAGEILDIDGVTGGFNFQSAWTTAWIAGQGIASWE